MVTKMDSLEGYLGCQWSLYAGLSEWVFEVTAGYIGRDEAVSRTVRDEGFSHG